MTADGPAAAATRRTASLRRRRGPGGGARGEIELSIEGMTCAACAVRIEKKLTSWTSVRATVNYATATARVTAPAALPVAELIAAVEQAGYTARRSPACDELAGVDRPWEISIARANRTTRPPGTPPTCAAG